MSKPDKRVLFTADPKFAVARKRFDASGAESDEGEEKITLSGYAMVWNSTSDDRGGFVVRLLPGSAKFATPTMALYHHSYMVPLGNTANGSLRLSTDDVGVKVEIDLPGTTAAADVAVLVEDGFVGGMSFSMLYDDVLTTAEKNENGKTVMEVSAFTCDEVTVTAIPSFTDTSIGIKADDGQSPADAPQQMSKAPERIAQALKLEQYRLNAYTL